MLNQKFFWIKHLFYFCPTRIYQDLVLFLSKTLVAPAWKADELEKLITSKKITIDDSDPQAYWEILQNRSGGHPLFAVALAKKHPNQAKLILNMIESPNMTDTDLSKEIKLVLYQSILTNSDKQNFVQRLSLLTEKADESVLDAIRLQIEPNIETTSPNLIDEIGPAVLEGSLSEGIRVSPTF